jgi:hypothetical protein
LINCLGLASSWATIEYASESAAEVALLHSFHDSIVAVFFKELVEFIHKFLGLSVIKEWFVGNIARFD